MLNDQVHAPNMKRLQQSGVGFTNAYSVGLVCVPSRTSILTGRHPATFAAVEDSQEPVIADNYSKCKERPETFDSVLKARGYRVFYYGKWHAPLRWAVNPSGQPTYENGVCMNGGTPLISDEPHHRFRDATNCLKVTSPCRYLPFSNLKNTPTFCKRLSTRSLIYPKRKVRISKPAKRKPAETPTCNHRLQGARSSWRLNTATEHLKCPAHTFQTEIVGASTWTIHKWPALDGSKGKEWVPSSQHRCSTQVKNTCTRRLPSGHCDRWQANQTTPRLP